MTQLAGEVLGGHLFDVVHTTMVYRVCIGHGFCFRLVMESRIYNIEHIIDCEIVDTFNGSYSNVNLIDSIE